LWLFDAERITSEDLERTAMLRQEQARQQLLNSDGGLSGYLDSLELQVEMREADARDLPRVAQLTQKTNQFNLSLRRRTIDEIKALGNDCRTFVLSARDKFGDYGQIGVCILRCEPSESRALEIDTFLASCRALGRGVEDAFLYGVFEVARRLDLSAIHAPFVAGPRNQPAREFFARCEFREKANGRFEAEVEQDFTLPKHVRFQLDHRDAIAT
jgi:FkbH-like protein